MDRCHLRASALVISVVFALSGFVSATADDAGGAEDDDSVLRIGFVGRIDSLNPYLGTTRSSDVFYGLVYGTLNSFDQNLMPCPGLAAERWTVPVSDAAMSLSGEPCGSVWQYNLTEGARWHDGEPFTADDVVWNLNLLAENWDVLWQFPAYSEYMSYSEKLDDLTVRTHFYDRVTHDPRPAAFGGSMPVIMLPYHLMEDMDATEIGFTWEGVFDGHSPPIVGTGPYMVTEDIYDQWTSGAIELVPNPECWLADSEGLTPRYDRIELRSYDDPTAIAFALETGEIDVADAGCEFAGAASEDDTLYVSDALCCTGDLVSMEFSGVEDQGNLIRMDPLVRQAMAAAVDREAIVEECYGGFAVEGSSLVSPVFGVWHYEAPADDEMSYDPDAAEEALDSAGYVFTTESPTVRVASSASLAVTEGWVAEGSPLSFSLVVLSRFVPEYAGIVDRVTATLAEVGIDVQYSVSSVVILPMYSGEWYELCPPLYSEDMVLARRHYIPDPHAVLFTQSSGAYGQITNNWYADPAYDSAFDSSASEMDPDTRLSLALEAQRIQYHDVSYIVLAYPKETLVANFDLEEEFGNWTSDPGLSIFNSWGVVPFALEPIADDDPMTDALPYLVLGICLVVVAALVILRVRRTS